MVGTQSAIEPLISQAEAARATGIPLRTLQHLIARRRLRCYQVAGGVRRLKLSDVQTVIRVREVDSMSTCTPHSDDRPAHASALMHEAMDCRSA